MYYSGYYIPISPDFDNTPICKYIADFYHFTAKSVFFYFVFFYDSAHNTTGIVAHYRWSTN